MLLCATGKDVFCFRRPYKPVISASMKSILYVSPSIIPSRTANSIHVINQVNALAEIGYFVTLVCATQSAGSVRAHVKEFYGLNLHDNVTIDTFCLRWHRAINLQIGVFAFFGLLKKYGDRQIISRNFYFSLFSAIFRRGEIFECHGIEVGIKALLQKFIIFRHVHTIVISDALKCLLMDKFNLAEDKFLVLHDAASHVETINVDGYIVEPERQKIGYFGHVYPGRGIEVVSYLAEKFNDVDFYVVGGEPDLVATFSKENQHKNLIFVGHVSNIVARSLMQEMDILLMPYQKVVSIGPRGSDTSQWMSPLKMFEYMSSQVAIASSDLPVIREVLQANKNCLLVPPDDHVAWWEAVDKLLKDETCRAELASTAFKEFREKYTWKQRAKAIRGSLERF